MFYYPYDTNTFRAQLGFYYIFISMQPLGKEKRRESSHASGIYKNQVSIILVNKYLYIMTIHQGD